MNALIAKVHERKEPQTIKLDKEIRRQYRYGHIKLVIPSTFRIIIQLISCRGRVYETDDHKKFRNSEALILIMRTL